MISSETDLLPAIQEKLTVSAKVARRLLEEYRTVFQVECLGEGVFDLGYGGDPARAYDRSMRRTLLLQRMGEVLSPRELNLVRCYLGIGQPNEQGMTFQELAIRLNYNGPSGAEKAYKSAIRKLRKQLNDGAYGQWLSIQKAIHKARAEAETDSGYYVPPQTTWLDEKELAVRFLCEVISLIHVHEIIRDAVEQKQNKQCGTRLCPDTALLSIYPMIPILLPFSCISSAYSAWLGPWLSIHPKPGT